MQRDGQVLVVELPQFLERALGLAARVDEHERGFRRADRVHHIGHRVDARDVPPTAHRRPTR